MIDNLIMSQQISKRPINLKQPVKPILATISNNYFYTENLLLNHNVDLETLTQSKYQSGNIFNTNVPVLSKINKRGASAQSPLGDTVVSKFLRIPIVELSVDIFSLDKIVSSKLNAEESFLIFDLSQLCDTVNLYSPDNELDNIEDKKFTTRVNNLAGTSSCLDRYAQSTDVLPLSSSGHRRLFSRYEMTPEKKYQFREHPQLLIAQDLANTNFKEEYHKFYTEQISEDNLVDSFVYNTPLKSAINASIFDETYNVSGYTYTLDPLNTMRSQHKYISPDFGQIQSFGYSNMYLQLSTLNVETDYICSRIPVNIYPIIKDINHEDGILIPAGEAYYSLKTDLQSDAIFKINVYALLDIITNDLLSKRKENWICHKN